MIRVFLVEDEVLFGIVYIKSFPGGNMGMSWLERLGMES